jgi:hypothetical protein
MQVKPLVVAGATLGASNSWVYQLKDNEGVKQDGGKWFAEADVKPDTKRKV